MDHGAGRQHAPSQKGGLEGRLCALLRDLSEPFSCHYDLKARSARRMPGFIAGLQCQVQILGLHERHVPGMFRTQCIHSHQQVVLGGASAMMNSSSTERISLV